MNPASEPVGTLEVALAHTARLLEADPALAIEQAGEILKVVPGHPSATLLLAAGKRLTGDFTGALQLLRPLAATHAGWAQCQYELALALAAAGCGEEAVTALQTAVRLRPDLPDAWRHLADHLTALGETAAADQAYAQHIRFSTRNPRLLDAAHALAQNEIPTAEAMLRQHLLQAPTDVTAIRMLAEVAARLGRYTDAEHLLSRCLELAPGFTAARHNYALVLHRQNKSATALTHIDQALAADSGNAGYSSLKAAILSSVGEYDSAIELYRQVIAVYPRNARLRMSFAHTLKTAGRQQQAIDEYRHAIALAPQLGEAYWSLANLKTVRLSNDDIDAMCAQLERGDLSIEDRFHLHFALGKAYEDQAQYANAFRHYAQGNEQRRATIRYDADENSEQLHRSKRLFTTDFFTARRGWGCQAPDPIFIVGLPRAGSTLLEQILASHPMVEGTMELPYIVAIARELSGPQTRDNAATYRQAIASLSEQQCRELGERYLAQARIHRKDGRPFFIDKLPNNFAHTGLIQLILPNARIIDARRHPLGCCFSAFKQHFARGQHFSYSLTDVGRYYRDYVELMAHFDAVLPGRIHRVIYEQMVTDTETHVRALLDYCALPFNENCLRFYENDRAVRTASSEQVRRPIYRDGVDHWRHFESWLEPLKLALGTVVDAYPGVPRFENAQQAD